MNYKQILTVKIVYQKKKKMSTFHPISNIADLPKILVHCNYHTFARVISLTCSWLSLLFSDRATYSSCGTSSALIPRSTLGPPVQTSPRVTASLCIYLKTPLVSATCPFLSKRLPPRIRYALHMAHVHTSPSVPPKPANVAWPWWAVTPRAPATCKDELL